MEKLASIFKYLGDRPLVLKIIDMILVLIVVFGVSSAYIIATNFKAIFLSDTEKEYTEFVNAVEANKQITNILERLRSELAASRVGIYLGVGNVPFFFYSQTFEAIAAGVSSEMNKNQRISISIDTTVNAMTDGEAPFDYSVEVDQTTSFGHILASQGVIQYYRHALYTLDEKFIGFIMIEYQYRKELDPKMVRNVLQRYGSAISGILLGQ